MAKTLIENDKGIIYENISSSDKKKFQKVLSDTFITEKYKMRTYSELRVSLEDGEPHRRTEDLPWFRENRIANPHIRRFDCFGQSREDCMEAASTGNYMGLFMRLKVQSQNVNFADTTVVREWMRVLHSNPDVKIFEDADTKECYSLAELVQSAE